MNKPDSAQTGLWPYAAGIAPALVAATSLKSSLAIAGAFLLCYAVAMACALFLPRGLAWRSSFALASLFAVLAATLFASLVRVLDPFLFEDISLFLFLTPFLPPVLGAACAPGSEAERERAWESAIAALGLALAIALFGLVREFLVSGGVSLFGGSKGAGNALPGMAHPAGALLMLAAALALVRAARSALGRKSS